MASARLGGQAVARRGRTLKFGAVALCGLTWSACGPGEAPATGTLKLVPAGEVALVETDSTFVGEAYGLVLHPDGSMLIPDRKNATIRVYSSTGAFTASLGRSGSGPGEFAPFPVRLDLASESLLVVQSPAGVVRAVRYPSVQQVWELKTPPWGMQVAAKDGAVYMTGINAESSTSLVEIAPGGSTRSGGPFTELMGANRTLSTAFSQAAVALLGGDTVAVAQVTNDSIFIGPFQGPFKSIVVPLKLRRGAQATLLEAVRDKEGPETLMAAAYKSSVPVSIARSPNGILIYVAADQTFIQQQTRVTGNLFVSVVDPERGEVCGEVQVPVPNDPHPQVAIRGDTLFALNQIEGAEGVRSAVAKFVVDAGECW